jgi:hypothetical protein
MTKFATISLSAAAAVSALDAYLAVLIAHSMNPYSLNCASSSIIMFTRTHSAATFLIPTVVAGMVAFEFSRRHLTPAWRITTFLPIAVGIGLLIVTKFMRFW